MSNCCIHENNNKFKAIGWATKVSSHNKTDSISKDMAGQPSTANQRYWLIYV